MSKTRHTVKAYLYDKPADARHERMVQININNRVRQWASGGEPAERFPTLTG